MNNERNSRPAPIPSKTRNIFGRNAAELTAGPPWPMHAANNVQSRGAFPLLQGSQEIFLTSVILLNYAIV